MRSRTTAWRAAKLGARFGAVVGAAAAADTLWARRRRAFEGANRALDLTFTRGGRPLYRSTTFVGFVGVLTALRCDGATAAGKMVHAAGMMTYEQGEDCGDKPRSGRVLFECGEEDLSVLDISDKGRDRWI